MVEAEAEHCNVWQCSIAEDASGKDLCFHVVTVHHKSTTSGQARCTTEENNQLFITHVMGLTPICTVLSGSVALMELRGDGRCFSLFQASMPYTQR
jgi:hypothetical protein